MTKIEAAIQEYADWCSVIGVDTLEKLRNVTESGRIIPLINLCEARQERKYAEIANQIYLLRAARPRLRFESPSSVVCWDSPRR